MPRSETNSRAAKMPVKVARPVAFTVSPGSASTVPEIKAIKRISHAIGKLGTGPKL